MSFLKSVINTISVWLNSQEQRNVEAWLADSTDVVEIEHKQKSLERVMPNWN